MYSEALRARDWNERKIGDLVSPQKAKKPHKLDQPMIQDLNDTINDLKTDPLVALALPMEINNLELDKIVMGIRKVSDVVRILYDFYKGPELSPMMSKIVTEIREVMDMGIFTGEVKKNIIV